MEVGEVSDISMIGKLGGETLARGGDFHDAAAAALAPQYQA